MTTPRLKNVTPHSDAGQDATHLDEVHYPIDDDEPLAESEYQLFPLTYAHAALTGWYESLGVQEYWIYDPTEEGYIEPRLRGYTLVDGEYQPIEIREVDGRHVGVSEMLGLELHADAEWFRFFDPESGEYLPDTYEKQRALEESEKARRELESLLREHGIEPPPKQDGDA